MNFPSGHLNEAAGRKRSRKQTMRSNSMLFQLQHPMRRLILWTTSCRLIPTLPLPTNSSSRSIKAEMHTENTRTNRHSSIRSRSTICGPLLFRFSISSATPSARMRRERKLGRSILSTKVLGRPCSWWIVPSFGLVDFEEDHKADLPWDGFNV